ncbi:MAG: DUF2726 domain-containing protein [Candidatus Peregrinibacteria bacterium]
MEQTQKNNSEEIGSADIFPRHSNEISFLRGKFSQDVSDVSPILSIGEILINHPYFKDYKKYLPQDPVLEISDNVKNQLDGAYALRTDLFHDNSYELRVFNQFQRLLKDFSDYYIFPHMPLKDIFISKKKTTDEKAWHHIRDRHIDFLICKMKYKKLKPLLAIEVQGKPHDPESEKFSEKTFLSDQFKKLLFDIHGLSLLRIKDMPPDLDGDMYLIKEFEYLKPYLFRELEII